MDSSLKFLDHYLADDGSVTAIVNDTHATGSTVRKGSCVENNRNNSIQITLFISSNDYINVASN